MLRRQSSFDAQLDHIVSLVHLRLHAGILFRRTAAVAFKGVLMAVFVRFVVAAFVSVPIMGLLENINFALTDVSPCIFLSR